MTAALETGAANCVVECAGVARGTHLFVVSQTGAVGDEVAAAIATVGRDAGARVTEIHANPIPAETPDAIPAAVLEAYASADVLISHFPSLKREALHPHFPGETRVRVPNRAVTAALMASDWAVFPYRVQRTIARRFDALMAPGKRFRITSPAGTDIAGTFAGTGGEVGAAYFIDTEEGRARRNFPGGVHSPRNSAALNGVIVVEYKDGDSLAEGDAALRIEVADGRVVAATGGDAAGCARDAILATDRWIDSWHAGVNPRTRVPVNRTEKPRAWFGFSHCSPAVMHFHLGRTHATINLATFNHTLEVDGTALYEDGALALLDDHVIAGAINGAALPSRMLDNAPFPFW